MKVRSSYRAALGLAVFSAASTIGGGLMISPAAACGGFFDAGCNLSHGGLSPQNIVKQTAQAATDTREAVAKAGTDTRVAVAKAGTDTRETIAKAGTDTRVAIGKAGTDARVATVQAVQDVGTASVTIAKFVERQMKGMASEVGDAARRIQEGKVVDAIWHLSVAPLKQTEQNAALAAQESNILRTVGQVAATAYGGPGGAAAYAAWYAYRATGNADLALRVAIITGATSAGFSAAGQLPADTVGQIAQKAIVTGAIGGLAVAAAGGDAEAVKDGFLLSGGMVLVQAGFEKVTTHPIDGRASQGEAYCMATVGAECSPPKSAYVTDANGNIQFDKNGEPLVDVTKTDPIRPHVGTWSKEADTPLIGVGERSASMTAVSRVPGMNAMAVFHDTWTVAWDMNAFTKVTTIVPAVVLTYTGTGAPYYEHLEDTAAANRQKAP